MFYHPVFPLYLETAFLLKFELLKYEEKSCLGFVGNALQRTNHTQFYSSLTWFFVCRTGGCVHGRVNEPEKSLKALWERTGVLDLDKSPMDCQIEEGCIPTLQEYTSLNFVK